MYELALNWNSVAPFRQNFLAELKGQKRRPSRMTCTFSASSGPALFVASCGKCQLLGQQAQMQRRQVLQYNNERGGAF